MITVRAYTAVGVRVADDPDEISDILDRNDGVLWVDVVDPTDADLACLQAEFALHDLAIEDITKHGQRPKLEEYSDHVFLVAYSCRLAEVDLFVGKHWLLTVRERGHDGETWDATNAVRRFERNLRDEPGVGFLLYTVLDDLVDGYFLRTDENEDRIEALEERIFEEDLPDEQHVQQELFDIRRDLLEFRRRVAPLRDVVNALSRGDVPWVSGEVVVHLRDVYDHVTRVLELVDLQRELIGNAADAHLAVISNRMNQVMKKMTSWGAILLASTLIAGIYGMNFEHMPELRWRLGYPFALGLMALATAAGYTYFKRRDWL